MVDRLSSSLKDSHLRCEVAPHENTGDTKNKTIFMVFDTPSEIANSTTTDHNYPLHAQYLSIETPLEPSKYQQK